MDALFIVVVQFVVIQTLLLIWIRGLGLSAISYDIGNGSVAVFLWYFLGVHWRHSHVRIAYPRWLSYILISPYMHQIHHSKEPRHFDKNMGSIFSVWDYLFGTLYISAPDEEFKLGVAGAPADIHGTLRKAYLEPFVSFFKRSKP